MRHDPLWLVLRRHLMMALHGLRRGHAWVIVADAWLAGALGLPEGAVSPALEAALREARSEAGRLLKQVNELEQLVRDEFVGTNLGRKTDD